MLADIALRQRDYAEADLFDPRGRYGSVQPVPLGAARRRHGARLGPGHQHLRRLAGLAGLPARAVRPRRQGRRLGVRQPRRAGRLRRRPARHAGCCAGRAVRAQEQALPTGDPEGWLVVVDLQHVFADADSPWGAPRFAEIRPRDRASSSRPSATGWCWTRFVAPERPAGAWVAYYEQFPFALQPPDAPLLPLVDDPGRRTRSLDATTFGKWGPELAAVVGDGPLTRRRRGHRLLRDLHRAAGGRRRRPGRGWSPTPAPGPATPTTSARCGVMALYAPLVAAGDDGRGAGRAMIPAPPRTPGCRDGFVVRLAPGGPPPGRTARPARRLAAAAAAASRPAPGPAAPATGSSSGDATTATLAARLLDAGARRTRPAARPSATT